MEDVGSLLSANDRKVIKDLLDVFAEIDEKARDFKERTGIRCPAGCGICCATSCVETTPLEMLPLAVHLWQEGEADLWLERINKAVHPGKCVFFEADERVPGNGGCLVYEYRPFICRLFGFFTVRDKNGKYLYGSCRVIKEKYPESYRKAVALISETTHPSNITDYSIRVISMASDISRKMTPVNRAAAIAIEKIGFDLEKARWETPLR